MSGVELKNKLNQKQFCSPIIAIASMSMRRSYNTLSTIFVLVVVLFNKLIFITQNQNVISTSNVSPPVFHMFFVFIHGLVCDSLNEMFGATHV
jgi:hypothetical protein